MKTLKIIPLEEIDTSFSNIELETAEIWILDTLRRYSSRFAYAIGIKIYESTLMKINLNIQVYKVFPYLQIHDKMKQQKKCLQTFERVLFFTTHLRLLASSFTDYKQLT